MPLVRPQQATRSRSTPNSRESPPTKKGRRKRLDTNITSIGSLERVTMAIDKLLQRYLDAPRHNYRTLAPDIRDLVSPENAMCLHPVNAAARLRVARIVQRQIKRFDIASMTPLQWVTIAPGRFALPIEQSREFNLKPLIACIRQAFGSVPFIAFIEAAHYRPSRGLGMHRGDVVSWHVHVITMGASTVQLQRLLKPFKARHANMVGRRCVHIASIEPDEVLTKALYASKAQIKSYRHYLTRETEIDPETGEVMHRMAQGKDIIRTGDLVRMVEMFDRMRIDQLIFGNGVGTDLVNVIRFEAMQPYCEWAASEIGQGREQRSDHPYVASYRALGNQLRRKYGGDFLRGHITQLRVQQTRLRQ